MAPPVVLEMDVQCYKCARKTRKAVENLPGTYVRNSIVFLSQVDVYYTYTGRSYA